MDFTHKVSAKCVKRYQKTVIGDVSRAKLAGTRMAKSVLDVAWGMFTMQVQYKGQKAGKCIEVVSEKFTTQACSSSGALKSPRGASRLVVRAWVCSECGAEHDRDVNAARNILLAGLRSRASVCGNESSHDMLPVEQDTPVLARYGWGACYVAS